MGEYAPAAVVHPVRVRPGAAVSARLRLVLELGKVRIAALSTLSAATGSVVCARSADWALLPLCAGVLCVAMGACALNQVQDRSYDALMERTRRRPLVRGALPPRAAVAAGASLIAFGLTLLMLAGNRTGAALAAAAVLWYNGLYAYLKRRWALAVIPGALIGALPPVIGWTSAGGGPWDRGALALALFFFSWQVPHFWLLVLARADDYARAGLPSPAAVFGSGRLSRMTSLWMLGAVIASLLLPLPGLAGGLWAGAALAALGLWVMAIAWRSWTQEPQPGAHGRAFRSINAYALGVMLLLIVGSLL